MVCQKYLTNNFRRGILQPQNDKRIALNKSTSHFLTKPLGIHRMQRGGERKRAMPKRRPLRTLHCSLMGFDGGLCARRMLRRRAVLTSTAHCQSDATMVLALRVWIARDDKNRQSNFHRRFSLARTDAGITRTDARKDHAR